MHSVRYCSDGIADANARRHNDEFDIMRRTWIQIRDNFSISHDI